STEKVDLTKLIDRVLKELKPKADEKNMRVSYKKNIPSLVVRGDKEKLRTVISNLMGNAIKFTPDGGMIWISVKEGKRSVHFNIKDNGIGIPIEHQSRIFDKFHQVDTSASREFEGMGLGLAICKEIIDLHGGRIWLKSKPSEGSEFHFNIPIR
ncbi:MAG: HAMP domain-containing histidine kinase, partial [Candidatus Altiarchaeales archaeon]|nr:HAMP domain-containing histidine kinase [Candidatus Altiarchaeales archaeon]